jgi:uracil-DNA glycosylase family 4
MAAVTDIPVPLAPSDDCPLCPRLAAFRQNNRRQFPDWYNAPVPSFEAEEGLAGVKLLIVGLAPGLRGANRTGRPFTGDAAGEVLYPALLQAGLARGRYDARPDDGLRLRNCMITNAVRCVPPQNKPSGSEAASCRRFLASTLAALPALQVILALGRIAHDGVVSALNARRSIYMFAHGARHQLEGFTLIDSYHCSRYNLNTGTLTLAMFDAVIAQAAACVQTKA